MVYSTRRFVLCLTLCYFVLVFFSPFSIAITSLGEKRANLSAFRTFVRSVLVWFCRCPLHLGVLEGLRFVIVAFPGIFSYPFLNTLFVTAALVYIPSSKRFCSLTGILSPFMLSGLVFLNCLGQSIFNRKQIYCMVYTIC